MSYIYIHFSPTISIPCRKYPILTSKTLNKSVIKKIKFKLQLCFVNINIHSSDLNTTLSTKISNPYIRYNILKYDICKNKLIGKCKLYT